jgi:ADP-ribosylation factor-like protein 2
VGGQRTLRPYWRNYFESTDAVVWVVDSSDRIRMDDCRVELKGLLQEEVSSRLGTEHRIERASELTL